MGSGKEIKTIFEQKEFSRQMFLFFLPFVGGGLVVGQREIIIIERAKIEPYTSLYRVEYNFVFSVYMTSRLIIL